MIHYVKDSFKEKLISINLSQIDDGSTKEKIDRKKFFGRIH